MKRIENVVRVTQFIKARRERVFEAWINPELMKRWFCPEELSMGVVEADARVGGSYRIEMYDEDETYTAFGVYQEIVPNEKLIFTHGWEIPEGPNKAETLVTVEFKEISGGTEITLIHERFTSKDSAIGHEEGWISTLKNLANNLTGNTHQK